MKISASADIVQRLECCPSKSEMRVRFPLSAPIADIVQLAERTLGKGKVPSSILGFSTS